MLEVSPTVGERHGQAALGNGVVRACTVPRRQLTSQGGGRRFDDRRHAFLELYLTQHLVTTGAVCTPKRSGSSTPFGELIERMASALDSPNTIHTVIPFPRRRVTSRKRSSSRSPRRASARSSSCGRGTQDAARLRYFAEQGLTPGVLLTVSGPPAVHGPTTSRWCPQGTRAW